MVFECSNNKFHKNNLVIISHRSLLPCFWNSKAQQVIRNTSETWLIQSFTTETQGGVNEAKEWPVCARLPCLSKSNLDKLGRCLSIVTTQWCRAAQQVQPQPHGQQVSSRCETWLRRIRAVRRGHIPGNRGKLRSGTLITTGHRGFSCINF